MSKNRPKPEADSILEEGWNHIVGGMSWLKSVFFGEFVDDRPLSAIVADMLLSFLPGVVIVTSARDAVAVVLRLANHPEKREELMEWILLCACLITIALPIAMAAGGTAAAGVGAVVGGIAGSELAAALRGVMLTLIKKASALVDLVLFLQKFIKGDVLKFLRAVKFVKYEKALLQALTKIIGKLVGIVRSLRQHLENLRYFDSVKVSIAQLAEWERKFYSVQQDALRQIPRALGELDGRLAKVLAQTAPKEIHTVSSGIQADKILSSVARRQRVRDTAGKIFAKAEDQAPQAVLKPEAKTAPKQKQKILKGAAAKPSLKDKPDSVDPSREGPNVKRQAVADSAAVADRQRITQLSNEARDAEKSGNKVLAAAKIKEAQNILRPHLPKGPNDSWDEVVKRLDVSSPKDGAVFWSGTATQAKATGHSDAARKFAEKIGGVTLETTPGGRIIDGWEDVQKMPWNADSGPPPWASGFWQSVSEKYANLATGKINVVQTPDKLWHPGTVWHTQEKPTLLHLQELGQIADIKIHVVDAASGVTELPKSYVEKLLQFDQRKK
jgi:hypothetical protein